MYLIFFSLLKVIKQIQFKFNIVKDITYTIFKLNNN